MSFSEVGKAAMDVVKETQEKAKELLKNIDSRIDVKNTLTDNLTKNDNKDKINDADSRIDFNKMQERMNDSIIGGKSDIDSRIDVNKNLIDRYNGNDDIKKNSDIKHNNYLQEINNIFKDKTTLNEFFKKYPEFKEKIDKLKNSKISDQERQKIEREIKTTMKGKYFEFLIKKYCETNGLSTLNNIKLDNKEGKTVTDYIGKNETNKNIKIFNKIIRPGETIHIEDKGGAKKYIGKQIEHINKQLKTDFNHKFLVTTNDAKDIKNDLKKICDDNKANLIITDLSAQDINEKLGV